MIRQFIYFRQDLKRLVGKHKIRILHIWLGRNFWGVLVYRFERGLLGIFGRYYKYLRVLLIPVFNLIYAYSNIEINYNADIKGGLLVLHPAAGIVISRFARIGENLTLTGGNIIGGKAGTSSGDIQIGDNCFLGANAVVLGPIRLGNEIHVAALACVVQDYPEDHVTLRGVPARAFPRNS